MKKKKQKDIFNPAFQDLKFIIKDKKNDSENDNKKHVIKKRIKKSITSSPSINKESASSDRPEPSVNKESASSDRPEPSVNKESGSSDKPDDDLTFLDAMSDVEPLQGPKKIPRPTTPINKSALPPPDEEKEVISHLYGLVYGSIEMDITFSDEYMEGCIKGVGRNIMKKLKKGHFPVQDYIDLHGLSKKEAEEEVKKFLVHSHRMGLKCVLIVHGRGLNSPDSFPVLKEGLPRWLGRGPVKKIVLAFATAKPYDGGTGALYVLLRKR